MIYFSPDFLQFFKELAPNNHKDWFDLNRSRYEKEVKLPMQIFIQDLINELAKKDKKIKIGPKDAIFRINKDVGKGGRCISYVGGSREKNKNLADGRIYCSDLMWIFCSID